MPEFLVVVACLYGKGCAEASTTYYNSNQELQMFTKNVERSIKDEVPETLITYLAPALLYGSGRAGLIQISTSVNLKLSRTSSELIYRKEF